MVECCWYLSACLTKNCLIKKHKGGLLVLSILWFSLLLLARYTPGLVRINFDRRWYTLLRPRCPSVHRCFSACLCRIQICCRLDTIRKLPGHQWLCGVTSFWLGKHSKAVGVSKIQKGDPFRHIISSPDPRSIGIQLVQCIFKKKITTRCGQIHFMSPLNITIFQSP